VLESLSDEFNDHLQSVLASFCYGAQTAGEDAEYYSVSRTIEEFFRRYDSKPIRTRIGMAGELVVHLFMPHAHPDLLSAAVFFNKEERSIKKGFDLTFRSAVHGDVWYGEVKSGEASGGQTADEKAKDLLETASSDLKGKLGPKATQSHWDSAIVDAGLTLASGQAATMKRLLRSDHQALRAGKAIVKRAVLAATVMHPCDHCRVSEAAATWFAAAARTAERFSEVRVLVVQQPELETVIAQLRELGSHG
jgi:hypothetical protein